MGRIFFTSKINTVTKISNYKRKYAHKKQKKFVLTNVLVLMNYVTFQSQWSIIFALFRM